MAYWYVTKIVNTGTNAKVTSLALGMLICKPWKIALGSENRKKESKVVAKRQGSEKPVKIEQMKEWGPRVKQTALLASPIYIGQAQGQEKKITRGAKIEPRACLSCLLGWMYFPLLANKTAVTLVHPSLQIFAVTEEITWGMLKILQARLQ